MLAREDGSVDEGELADQGVTRGAPKRRLCSIWARWNVLERRGGVEVVVFLVVYGERVCGGIEQR